MGELKGFGCSTYDDYDILFGGNNKSFLIMVLEDHCASGKSYLDGAYEMRIEYDGKFALSNSTSSSCK